jgi:hypothetical protein
MDAANMIHIAHPVNGSTELLKPTSLTHVLWVHDECDGNRPIISKMLVDDGLSIGGAILFA